MSLENGFTKRLRNRTELFRLGHKFTASAVEEIKKVLPDFTLTTGYPKVKGQHPSLAALVRHVRGIEHLTFDHERPVIVTPVRPPGSRRASTHGGDFPRNNVWDHLSQ